MRVLCPTTASGERVFIFHSRRLNNATYPNEEVSQEKGRHGIWEAGTQPRKEEQKSQVPADGRATAFEHIWKRCSCL